MFGMTVIAKQLLTLVALSLSLSADESKPMPEVLSKTGVFTDTRTLALSDSFVRYEINVPFWSDGAEKQRWIALPAPHNNSKIRFSPESNWEFPAGTVLVKHFELAIDGPNQPKQRLETRILVCDGHNGVRGASYRWRPDHSDADLVTNATQVTLAVNTPSGHEKREWFFPGVKDCRTCHTHAAGGVLGISTRQLNRTVPDRTGQEQNQLSVWGELGLLDTALREDQIAELPRLAAADHASRSIEDRARSFLDANCAYCHRPGGVVADFDARYQTPLEKQAILGAPARINLGIDSARQIAANDPWRSMILVRVKTLEPTRMPPLGHQQIDHAAVELLERWIKSMPGKRALEAPKIDPSGFDSATPAEVRIKHADPAAVIRYTLDGSPPGTHSAIYRQPLLLRNSATLRARAYKDGYTRSIIAQETFIIAE